LSGILKWALEGLELSNNEYYFNNSKTTEQIKIQYVRLNDSVQAYCMEHLEYDLESDIGINELYLNYMYYCQKNKLVAKPKNSFKNNLHKCMPAAYQTSEQIDDKTRKKIWKGLRCK
jgi:hypothetical protein